MPGTEEQRTIEGVYRVCLARNAGPGGKPIRLDFYCSGFKADIFDGLWTDGATRTTAREIAELIRGGQIAVASLRDRIVGAYAFSTSTGTRASSGCSPPSPRTAAIDEAYPARAPLLATPRNFVIYEKDLDERSARRKEECNVCSGDG